MSCSFSDLQTRVNNAMPLILLRCRDNEKQQIDSVWYTSYKYTYKFLAQYNTRHQIEYLHTYLQTHTHTQHMHTYKEERAREAHR